MVSDSASWHINRQVQDSITEHNRQARRDTKEVRILACSLSTKSLWPYPIEPKWIQGRRRVVNPNGLLTTRELAQRACESFGCTYQEHLAIPVMVT